MHDYKIIALASIFIVLLIVIYNAIKFSFDFNSICCLIISVCLSTLAIIGMNDFLSGSMEIVLMLYAAMAIVILALLLVSFIGIYLVKIKQWLSRCTDKKDIPETKKEQLRR